MAMEALGAGQFEPVSKLDLTLQSALPCTGGQDTQQLKAVAQTHTS